MLTFDRQLEHLNRVSRSFALTIPLLPNPLADWVGNAYLLCRIVDTLEDAPELPVAEKKALIGLFLQALDDEALSLSLPERYTSRLVGGIPESELQLLQDTHQVLQRSRSYPRQVQQVLFRAVQIMSEGMAQQQDIGIATQSDLDHYCYFVAGVVGELLYFLFAEQCPELQGKRQEMLPLAVSFGLGLQLTNILKDMRDDASRGVSWIPGEILQRAGACRESFIADELDSTQQRLIVDDLLALAAGHLQDALTYTSMIPARCQGMRQFCFWAIALAWKTLARIHHTPDFCSSADVKISRNEVKQAIIACRSLGWSNYLMHLYFLWLGRMLSGQRRSARELYRKLSRWGMT
jgi:Phytoene/squalene synthetase